MDTRNLLLEALIADENLLMAFEEQVLTSADALISGLAQRDVSLFLARRISIPAMIRQQRGSLASTGHFWTTDLKKQLAIVVQVIESGTISCEDARNILPISDEAFESKCLHIEEMLSRDEVTCIHSGCVLTLFSLGGAGMLSYDRTDSRYPVDRLSGEGSMDRTSLLYNM
jgi:hypothetical protein